MSSHFDQKPQQPIYILDNNENRLVEILPYIDINEPLRWKKHHSINYVMETTLLHFACRYVHPSWVKLLLEQGAIATLASVVKTVGSHAFREQETPLAAVMRQILCYHDREYTTLKQKERIEIVRLLLEYGADLEEEIHIPGFWPYRQETIRVAALETGIPELVDVVNAYTTMSYILK